MKESKPTVSLYLRLDAETDASIRTAVRGSPDKYRNISGFIRTAIQNQLDNERRKGKQA